MIDPSRINRLLFKKVGVAQIVGVIAVIVVALFVYVFYFYTEKYFLLDYQTKQPIALVKVKVVFGEFCEGSDYNDDFKRYVDGCGPDVLFDGVSGVDGSIGISWRYLQKMNDSYGANGGPDMSFLSDITVDGYSRLVNKSLLGNEFNNGKNYTYFVRNGG